MSIRFVTGGIGAGKTTRMAAMYAREPEGTAGGFLAVRRFAESVETGYDLLLLPQRVRIRLADRMPLTEPIRLADSMPLPEPIRTTDRMQSAENTVVEAMRMQPADGMASCAIPDAPKQNDPKTVFAFGPFMFYQDAFAAAYAHMVSLVGNPAIRTLYLDEVGPMELAGGGHAPLLRALLPQNRNWVMSVRSSCLEAVRHTFSDSVVSEGGAS